MEGGLKNTSIEKKAVSLGLETRKFTWENTLQIIWGGEDLAEFASYYFSVNKQNLISC